MVPNTSYTLSVYVALNLGTCPGDKVKCEVLDGATVIASYTVTASGTIQLPFFTGGASSITLKFSKLVGSPCSFQVDNLYLYYVDVQSQIVCDPTGTVLLSDDCSSISTWTGNGGASVNISAGKLEVSNAASSGNWYAECQTSVNLQAGVTYTLDFDLDMGNCSTGSVMAQHVEWTISTYFTDAAYSTSGHKTIVFTATSTGPASLWFNKSYPASSCTFYIDNVILTGPSAAKDQYRYGFNGKEKDNETYGNNNAYDFGARIYDPRLGRWFSVDKKYANYVPITTYGFCMNNPIEFKDKDGNLLVDQNGNIIYTKNGEPTRSESMTKEFSYTSISQNGQTTTTVNQITPIMQNVVIYTNDGVAVNASLLVGYEVFQTKTITDKSGNSVGNPVTKKIDYSELNPGTKLKMEKESPAYDCHGLTFTNGKLWIDDDQAQIIIDKEGTPLAGPNGAKFVTYNGSFSTDDNEIENYDLGLIHTTPVNGNGSVNSKRGPGKLVNNSTVEAEKKAYSGKENIDGKQGRTHVKTKYFSKESNKKIDIGTLGKDGLNDATGNEKLKDHVK